MLIKVFSNHGNTQTNMSQEYQSCNMQVYNQIKKTEKVTDQVEYEDWRPASDAPQTRTRTDPPTNTNWFNMTTHTRYKRS